MSTAILPRDELPPDSVSRATTSVTIGIRWSCARVMNSQSKIVARTRRCGPSLSLSFDVQAE